MFSTCFETFLPFSSILKLSYASTFSLEECKICGLGKGLAPTSQRMVHLYLITTNLFILIARIKKGASSEKAGIKLTLTRNDVPLLTNIFINIHL